MRHFNPQNVAKRAFGLRETHSALPRPSRLISDLYRATPQGPKGKDGRRRGRELEDTRGGQEEIVPMGVARRYGTDSGEERADPGTLVRGERWGHAPRSGEEA